MRVRGRGLRGRSSWSFAGALVVAGLAIGAPAAGAQVVCPALLCPAAPPASGGSTTTTAPAPAPDPGDTALAPVPAGSPSQVTSFVDPQHTAYATDGELSAPLEEAWSHRLAGSIEDVVAGDGRLFLVAGDGIQAFDVGTGKALWSSAGRIGPLAYDAGRLIASADGEVVALSAADGHELWRGDDHTDGARSSSPVATAGRVYYSTEGGTTSMIARDAATGRRLWQALGSGTGNTPTVDGAFVFGSYACGLTDAWNRATGSRSWATTSNCSGGGGSTAAASGGRLYVPEDGSVLDETNGGRVGSTPKTNGVFAQGLEIEDTTGQDDHRRLRAVRLSDGRTAWHFTFPESRTLTGGPATLVRAPAVGIGDTVWLVEQGELVGLALRTGRVVEADTTTPNAADTGELVPLGSGSMALLNDKTIVGIRSALRPGPAAVAARPTTYDVLIGRSVLIRGRVGSDLRAGRPTVTVEADPTGRGGYRRVATARPGADGRFEVTARLDRNSRVRVRVGRTTASAGTVFVYPRYRVRIASAGRTRFRARFSVRGPRSVRLTGRRAVVYVARPGARVFLRLGSGRLHRTSAGVHAGTFVARRRSYTTDGRDYLALCVPGAPRLGLGRASLLDRRCGRDRVPLR